MFNLIPFMNGWIKDSIIRYDIIMKKKHHQNLVGKTLPIITSPPLLAQPQLSTEYSRDDTNKEICGYVGWSIREILMKNTEKHGQSCEKVVFVKNMMISHGEAMMDSTYTQHLT